MIATFLEPLGASHRPSFHQRASPQLLPSGVVAGVRARSLDCGTATFAIRKGLLEVSLKSPVNTGFLTTQNRPC